ncbi:PilT/PilU family type 4a pilus ATPase [Patescibacteria group bacterium]|nr:PilT/PilU family type 4a pilus ATPase [Patescibacteria group bacterium]
MKVNLPKLLEEILEKEASDLHITVGSNIYIRVNTVLQPIIEYDMISETDIEGVLSQVMDDQQREIFEVNKELDFSVSLGQKARFRVNAFYQKGYPSLSLRTIPLVIPTLEELNLPDPIMHLCNLSQGLVLVVGPTGQGKSTTIAAMIDRINDQRSVHILTIEDPIEYMFFNKKSMIEQREMYLDTHSWDSALKSVLRQDPNVVLVGEMRDIETMSAALQIAETGHLVFATLHTNSATQTIDRIISAFPEAKRSEIRLQLAQVIEVVIAQRLLPSEKLGMVPAVELLLGTDAVRNTIREGKAHMLRNILNTSSNVGMFSLERSLANLVVSKLITEVDAFNCSPYPEDLKRLLKGVK